jgi:hypothetical protein
VCWAYPPFGRPRAADNSIGTIPDAPTATALLLAWGRGDQGALDQLMPLVYDEMRRLARLHLRRERTGHTLQATALVNEVYLRLIEVNQVQWQNRAHFFAMASRVMRRILVDSARARRYQERGGRSVLRAALQTLAASDRLPGGGEVMAHRMLAGNPRQDGTTTVRDAGGQEVPGAYVAGSGRKNVRSMLKKHRVSRAKFRAAMQSGSVAEVARYSSYRARLGNENSAIATLFAPSDGR